MAEEIKTVIEDGEIDEVVDETAEAELEAKTAARQAELFGEPTEEEDSTPEPEVEEPAEDETPTPEPEVNEVEVKKDDEVVAKDGDADKGEEESDETPPLSEAYYRAAIHRGWKPEDVDDLYKNNPELCNRTLGNIYESVNRSSKEFAALGRAHKVQQQTPQPAAQPAPQPAPQSDVNLVKLREEYPEGPLVDMVETLQRQNRDFQSKLDELSRQPAPAISQVQQREAQLTRQQIEEFFESEDIKQYTDFYGTVPKGTIEPWKEVLTPGQLANRWGVVEMMDQIVTGATAFGQEMTVVDGMNRAHLSVSEPIRETVIREKIKKAVVKRNSGITLEPSNAVTSEPKIKTEKDLEAVTEERLRKLFG